MGLHTICVHSGCLVILGILLVLGLASNTDGKQMKETMKHLIKKNFRDLRLVEMEHKYIHLDCVLITMIFGILFAHMVGPMLEPHDPSLGVIRLIAFIFSFSSLFWAWRFAVVFRKYWKVQTIKKEIRDSYRKGRDD